MDVTGVDDPRTNLVVRTAEQTDRAEIRRLLRELHPDGAESLTLPAIRVDAQTFIARVGEDAVGLAVVTFVDYGHEPYGMLEELVVDSSRRGTGVGRALVEECRAWLGRLGAEVVFVSAVDERAAEFYLGTGFERCSGPWLFGAVRGG
ncbi:GNAT family N-acetyltransferase [Kribbella sp. CA-247076]|uniref:GNAT family N-acetyltransferase n=1 Tax=Kribbella sp. CA-247076 TaxID=3239941 RepID=UPI003D8B1652